MYIQVSFLSKSNLTNKQKKQYIDKLFPEEPKPYDTKERNQGFIHKFNNAIGFKDVVDEDIEKIFNVLKMVVDRNISIRQYSGGECTYHVKIEYLDDKKEDI